MIGFTTFRREYNFRRRSGMYNLPALREEKALEDRVRKLRDGASGPVYGVRTRLECSCGMAFYATLTVGVDRPVAWCPWCRSRSVLYVEWHLDGPVREDAAISWHHR